MNISKREILPKLAMAAVSLLVANQTSALNVTINPGDQSVINNAINQVAAAGGGSVFMNSGTYTISGTVVMKGKVALDGTGSATYIRGSSSANTFANIECVTGNSDNMTLRDFRLDTWDGTGIGLHISSSNVDDDNNSINNVEQFHSSEDGINGGGQSHLSIVNSYVHDSGGGNLYHNSYWRRWTYPSVSGTRSLNSRCCGFKWSWGDHLTISATCTGNGCDGIITQTTTSQPTTDVTVNSSTLNSNNHGTYLFGYRLHVNSSTANSNTTSGFYVNDSSSGDMHNNNACSNPLNYDIHGSVAWKGSTYNNKACGVVQ
jgi:hypothetical protein